MEEPLEIIAFGLPTTTAIVDLARRTIIPDLVRLAEPVEYLVGIGGRRYKITVAKGYETDGSSQPRMLWWLVGQPLAPQYLPAATLHDILVEAELPDWPRPMADRLFDLLLDAGGVKKRLRRKMARAVKLYSKYCARPHSADVREFARRHLTLKQVAD